MSTLIVHPLVRVIGDNGLRWIPACIPTPGISTFIHVFVFILVFRTILYSVFHHSETDNRIPHRGTSRVSWNRQNKLNHENTDIRCIRTLGLWYIFHADIFAFVLTINAAYPAGPHFSRTWNNATNYGNYQNGTLTNARCMTCALSLIIDLYVVDVRDPQSLIALPWVRHPFQERATQASSIINIFPFRWWRHFLATSHERKSN